jgi:hypothetical protein
MYHPLPTFEQLMLESHHIQQAVLDFLPIPTKLEDQLQH